MKREARTSPIPYPSSLFPRPPSQRSLARFHRALRDRARARARAPDSFRVTDARERYATRGFGIDGRGANRLARARSKRRTIVVRCIPACARGGRMNAGCGLRLN